jgi:hypothetical protein
VKIIKQSVPGTLLVDGEKTALLMGNTESGAIVYLVYALVTQGPGRQILPASLLDDWGNEIGELGLYQWIQENGLRFPRAEVFGYAPSGQREQFFLRDLELFARYPVYAYGGDDEPANSGVLLQAILITDAATAAPQRIDPPDDLTPPLREARASWWQVGLEQADLEFLE